MNRRTFLVGLASATGAGSLALGTGAFSSASLERGVSVEVVPDDRGYLALQPGTAGGIIRIDNDGVFTMNPDAVDGTGINPNSTYKFGKWNESEKEVYQPAFRIVNQGTEEQSVEVTYNWNPESIGESSMTWFFTDSSGNSQFTADKEDSEETVVIQSLSVGEAIKVAFRIDAANLSDDLSGDITISSSVSE